MEKMREKRWDETQEMKYYLIRNKIIRKVYNMDSRILNIYENLMNFVSPLEEEQESKEKVNTVDEEEELSLSEWEIEEASILKKNCYKSYFKLIYRFKTCDKKYTLYLLRVVFNELDLCQDFKNAIGIQLLSIKQLIRGDIDMVNYILNCVEEECYDQISKALLLNNMTMDSGCLENIKSLETRIKYTDDDISSFINLILYGITKDVLQNNTYIGYKISAKSYSRIIPIIEYFISGRKSITIKSNILDKLFDIGILCNSYVIVEECINRGKNLRNWNLDNCSNATIEIFNSVMVTLLPRLGIDAKTEVYTDIGRFVCENNRDDLLKSMFRKMNGECEAIRNRICDIRIKLAKYCLSIGKYKILQFIIDYSDEIKEKEIKERVKKEVDQYLLPVLNSYHKGEQKDDFHYIYYFLLQSNPDLNLSYYEIAMRLILLSIHSMDKYEEQFALEPLITFDEIVEKCIKFQSESRDENREKLLDRFLSIKLVSEKDLFNLLSVFIGKYGNLNYSLYALFWIIFSSQDDNRIGEAIINIVLNYIESLPVDELENTLSQEDLFTELMEYNIEKNNIQILNRLISIANSVRYRPVYEDLEIFRDKLIFSANEECVRIIVDYINGYSDKCAYIEKFITELTRTFISVNNFNTIQPLLNFIFSPKFNGKNKLDYIEQIILESQDFFYTLVNYYGYWNDYFISSTSSNSRAKYFFLEKAREGRENLWNFIDDEMGLNKGSSLLLPRLLVDF